MTPALLPARTVLIRLAGPLQAWGTESRFGRRTTATEPSKSGVVGLCAAALGRTRGDAVDDLAALAFGVRVDREGVVVRDFHTYGRDGFLRASGKVERGEVKVSDRFYLADAAFTAGLEARTADGHALLDRIADALRAPRYPVVLGRRSCPPAEPVAVTTAPIHAALVDALAAAPRTAREAARERYVVDADAVDPASLPGLRTVSAADDPVSSRDRRFRVRDAVVFHLPPPL